MDGHSDTTKNMAICGFIYYIFFENWGKKSCFLDCDGAENRFKRDLLAESRRISQKNRILIMKNNFKRTLFYRRSILTFSTKISFFPISKSSLYVSPSYPSSLFGGFSATKEGKTCGVSKEPFVANKTKIKCSCVAYQIQPRRFMLMKV